MFTALSLLVLSAVLTCAHQEHLHDDVALDTEEWTTKYGQEMDPTFSGLLSFSHLPYTRCLEDISTRFDIAILGMPFDTGTSYRPGARFGPYAIRSGSRRQRALRGYTLNWGINPYASNSTVIDCGDVSVDMVNLLHYPYGCFSCICSLGACISIRQCSGHRPNTNSLFDLTGPTCYTER